MAFGEVMTQKLFVNVSAQKKTEREREIERKEMGNGRKEKAPLCSVLLLCISI